MKRRLHQEQPESFAFTPANEEWARGQISKYPEGRQASAVIPLLWRAQEQESWLSRPAIEYVADMLDMPYIRALEVATFYFMFHLKPVGKIAHIEVCTTTSCLICGAEDLIAVCKEMIASAPGVVSEDGNFSWEEVECQGACANAPMAMIGKDYYEDLTPEILRDLITRFGNGEVPRPGSQIGRYASEPASGLTTLVESGTPVSPYNGSVARAVEIGDTIKRIDGTEVPILTPWRRDEPAPAEEAAGGGFAAELADADDDAPVLAPLAESTDATAPAAASGRRPAGLEAAREGTPDNLQEIVGIGPALEKLCHELGFYHFDQIARWTDEEIAWVDDNLAGFKGRVTRDRWVAQAKIITDEGLDAFRRRAAEHDY